MFPCHNVLSASVPRWKWLPQGSAPPPLPLPSLTSSASQSLDVFMGSPKTLPVVFSQASRCTEQRCSVNSPAEHRPPVLLRLPGTLIIPLSPQDPRGDLTRRPRPRQAEDSGLSQRGGASNTRCPGPSQLAGMMLVFMPLGPGQRSARTGAPFVFTRRTERERGLEEVLPDVPEKTHLPYLQIGSLQM